MLYTLHLFFVCFIDRGEGQLSIDEGKRVRSIWCCYCSLLIIACHLPCYTPLISFFAGLIDREGGTFRIDEVNRLSSIWCCYCFLLIIAYYLTCYIPCNYLFTGFIDGGTLLERQTIAGQQNRLTQAGWTPNNFGGTIKDATDDDSGRGAIWDVINDSRRGAIGDTINYDSRRGTIVDVIDNDSKRGARSGDMLNNDYGRRAIRDAIGNESRRGAIQNTINSNSRRGSGCHWADRRPTMWAQNNTKSKLPPIKHCKGGWSFILLRDKNPGCNESGMHPLQAKQEKELITNIFFVIAFGLILLYNKHKRFQKGNSNYVALISKTDSRTFWIGNCCDNLKQNIL